MDVKGKEMSKNIAGGAPHLKQLIPPCPLEAI